MKWGDIWSDRIESVQQQFTLRLFRKFLVPYAPYTGVRMSRCRVCNLNTLEFRRLRFDMLFTFKIIHRYCNLDPANFFSFDRLGNLRVFHGAGILGSTFSKRVIPLYNDIPRVYREDRSLARFKTFLNSDQFYNLARHYLSVL